MNRCLWTTCLALAIGSCAVADEAARVQEELDDVRRERRRGTTAAERLAEAVRREALAEHDRIARREVAIAGLYRTEASYIYIDRERAAGRDPRALEREREKLLAAEWRRVQGRVYRGAAARRLAAEARLLSHWRRRWGGEDLSYADELRRAEEWAILGAEDLVMRERMRREAIIRRVLEVAEEMEREAQAKRRAKEGGEPR